MHSIQVFPNGTECDCGDKQHAVTFGEAQRKARMHAERNMPAVVIDRRKCSKKCRNGFSDRDKRISLHDIDCPVAAKGNDNG